MYLDEDAEEERQAEIKKLTPYNCPAFTPQPFNERRCLHCKYDRNLHTIIHTKQDYLDIIAKRNQDAMSADMKLNEANAILPGKRASRQSSRISWLPWAEPRWIGRTPHHSNREEG